MRNILTTILLLVALTVSAQNYSPCYKEKYEAGVALYNKGDYSGAKAKFVASKSCPMPNTVQADEWIKKCNAKLTPQPKLDPTPIVTEEYVVNGVAFKMVKVQGGTFTMGCTSEQGNDCWDNEKILHSVTVSDFWMGETEVTQALWKAVMGTEPSYKGGWTDEKGRGSMYSAYYVNWEECVQFCNRLNSLLLSQLPSGWRFALPTEAEWEYAARGGKHHSSYKYSGSDNVDEVAWYMRNSGYKAHHVKGKRANALGLYDMSGNMCEWCADLYDEEYYGVSPSTNPLGPTNGSDRVLRGGAFCAVDKYCRVAGARSHGSSDQYDGAWGFRLALVRR